MGYTSKVYLRLRGSSTGYYEITSPITISAPGIYDIFVQNFDQNGNPLDFIQSRDFVISNVDLIFYTVVKTNTEGEQEIVSPKELICILLEVKQVMFLSLYSKY